MNQNPCGEISLKNYEYCQKFYFLSNKNSLRIRKIKKILKNDFSCKN